ncbi:S-layer homology domain-containing protein [Acidaminococcus timonensis]|uniref:S-layer homology domain-containing protein n=1 Tax=Acidaminococcus timonensis TaxID=1871002 RepID=UPI0008D9AEAC
MALGHNSNVSYASTGVGEGTKASNTGTAVGYGSQSSGYQSAAVGAGSQATGQNAVSLGGGGAWGDYSIALGSGAGTNAHAIALGQNSGAWGENAIAIGEGTNAWRANSIVLGKNSKSGADKNIEGYDPRTGVASMDDTSTWYSTDEAVSIGRAEERNDEGNITVSAITRQLNNLAAGTLDTDAVNVAQLKAATQKVNMHDYSVWSPDTETDTNYTNGGAVAKNSMAAGVSASTTEDAENAVAIGYGAQAEGYGATVIGQYGKATGRYALAFGGQQTDTTAEQADNVASGDNALSFGERTTASGTNATAFGQETKALEKRATAFGQRTQATQSNATAFGIDTTASGQNATVFGNLTQATAIGATAFGNKNQATGQYATAWGGGDKVISNEDGTTTKIGTVASGTYATAFGERTTASGESATAFGSDSTASGKNSLAFGENSTAAAENSLAALGGTVAASATNAAAIGSGAKATLEDSVALGSGAVADRKSGAKGYDLLTKGDTTNTTAAWVSNANAIAVGNGSTLTRQITGVAAGSQDTDAVNVAQLKAAGFKVTTQNDGSISSSILNGDTLDFEGRDNAIVSTSKDSKTITVAVSKTPTFDSAVFYNPNPSAGQNNEKVTIANGQVTAGTAQIGRAPADTLKLTENGKETEKAAPAGSYVTGLSNKDWNTTNPSYVSGRAATEDQLAKVSEAIGNATTAAGKRTVVTVNDKFNPAEATPSATAGAYGDYDSNGGNLMIAAKKDSDGVLTYNIKLNDQLAIGQKGEPGVAGKDGKDGKVTVETKGGTTVVIGHDGEPGKDGKDGLFVTGKDGADGVSVTGPNGADGTDGKVGISGTDGKDAVSIAGKDGVGHIGLTGPKGEKGKDGISIDITTDLKSATLDDGKNVKTVIKDKEGKETTIEQAPRIQYQSDGKNYEVATMDDGLKFVGNDGKEVSKKLNSTLSLTGGITDGDALKKASSKNLGVRSNEKGDGLEIVMTDTPDFTKVTVGEGNDTTGKITIGKQTVTGKKSDGSDGAAQTGNYITGLDNKAWDKDNVVENRAATEGQLKDAIQQISGKAQGGFGLADETGNTVKQDLGGTIAVKGDGKNIQTKVKDGGLEISLNKDVDLGTDGSVKAGNTTIDQDGVDTNQVKVGGITITDQGINGGAKQITNIASGIDGNQYKTAGDNNAASIGDVKQLAQQEAQASEARSGKNITVKDHTVNLNDDINLGNDPTKQVTVKGSEGQVTIGSGDKPLTLGQQANGAGDKNPATGNFLNGLDNRNWDGEHIQNGRAATEDQLKTVSDKVKSGRVFQGDDGQKVTVGLGDTLKIQGGAKDVSSDNNIGIVKGAADTLQVRLAKDLTGLNSVTTGNTTINNGGLTIKTGDANRTITVQDGNVNMGGNTISGVAPGKVSPDSTEAVNGSQLYARDQAIGKLGNTVNHLDNKINRAGAGAAALAALHPQDFDPDDKWDFAAGYGNYHGASAAAIGAFYRPTEDVMVSVGGSMGGGENMVNAGVTFKLGQHNHVSNSRVAMAKEIRDLKATVGQLTQMVNQLTGNGGGRTLPLRKGDTLFPDVPKNHWAYDYVTKLAQAGLLEGYPDGEFKGNRMMTRYEFATLVYRAIMGGAAADPKLNQGGTLDRLVDEFGDELQYIRIVVIDRDKDGKPTIERVRTVEDDRKHHHGKEREQQPLEQGL